MSRLTRKTIGNNNYTVKKPKEEWLENIIQNSVNKLGKLEDLMEEYNLESIEDLENLLALQTVKVGGRLDGKTIIAKGILYNQLSDELGCPLEVVFRALNEGLCDNVVILDLEELEFIERPRLYYSDDFECYCFELLFGEYVVKLKDYRKTWWLKGEFEKELEAALERSEEQMKKHFTEVKLKKF